jgi:hypothetical protein
MFQEGRGEVMGELSANRTLCWSLPYIALGLIEQKILGDVSSGDHVWGHRIGS